MTARFRLLFTREIHRDLLAEARQKGFDICCESFIETRPVEPSLIAGYLHEILPRPIHAIFTSAHAVEAVLPLVGKEKLSWTVFSLDGETRAAVLRYQPEIHLITAPNAALLAEQIISLPSHRQAEWYFFCGNRRLDILPQRLSQQGISLREIEVYDTRLTPKRIATIYDGYAFFSPSSVESFFSLNRLTEPRPCFAIGETTAQALEHYASQVIVSPKPQTVFLLQTIYAYFGVEPRLPSGN
ncbi:uroporphyrinogen-III synthase [Thermoflavifilum thermophilum]|uniref:Uroporphyrinogen-III synthase n=1 Tax=Thermoflavifilum thermophilum TaxID=1393122 RepID=A0A1I7MXP5_9BACT|nr:uroporphyrinogen-III synthase [Thermoflavifilum thermophilum]SFV27150.1 uroporphyrinogen-III synthase [Thermoflavifilum thermophilum]